MKSLFEISQLAKIDAEEAKQYIQEFAAKKFDLDIGETRINQSEVALSSVNGFFTLNDGTEYFFKFHSEEGEIETVGEYYKVGVMEEAGFPVVTPVYQTSEPGEQFLIYPNITEPTFFDVLKKAGIDHFKTGSYDRELKNGVLQAEEIYCDICMEVAEKTLHLAPKEVVNAESVWQLFYRRLVSEKTTPRLDLFYTGKKTTLPNGEEMPFEQLSKLQWKINGIEFQESLAEIIASSIKQLNPLSQESWSAITAHGDDHNGNKFYFAKPEPTFQYFDPAFAGKHIPALLAFIKTTFHDCFAHPLWFYNSVEAEEFLEIDFKISNGKIEVRHNYDIDAAAPIRKEILEIKMKNIWKPLFVLLRNKKMLPENAKDFVKKALFCCPFLCLNLIDPKKFSPRLSLFGLSRAVEMGTYGKGNLIDKYLDAL